MTQNNRTIRKVTAAELQTILSTLTLASAWPQNVKDFIAANPPVLSVLNDAPSVKNIQHQMITIFAQNLGLGFTREDIVLIGNKLGRTKGDHIQWANKIEAFGLALDKGRGNGRGKCYGFAGLTFTDRYLTTHHDLTTDEGRVASEKRLRLLFKDMSEGNFEKGHKDPRKPLSDDNLVMQPYLINRPYRNRYIFDDNGLPAAPNPIEFVNDPSSYYKDEADLRLIYEGLKARFEPESVATLEDNIAEAIAADESTED